MLVGDDGEHDPELYRDVALEHPSSVAAIVLRTLAPPEEAAPEVDERVGEVPVVRGSDGVVLAERLARLGPDLRGAAGPDGPAAWFLTAAERGNDATRLRA